MPLDNIDIQILSYICKNPEATYKEIAGKIDSKKKIHPSTIFRRMNKLKKFYKMKPYISLENQFINYFVGLEIDIEKVDKFLSVFMNCPKVVEISRLSGKFNILMKMVFEDQRGLTLCVDQHVRQNESVKSISLISSSIPIKPMDNYLPEIILKEKSNLKTSPCGALCLKCQEYEINCLGCPSTKYYKLDSFPIARNRDRK